MVRLLWILFLFFAPLSAQAAVEVQKVTSPGGIGAWLVEEHTIPFVALEIRFRGGAALDKPGKRGAINLMTGLLEEGAADMDAQAFAQATEALAARFQYNVSDDALSISARALSENRPQAMALLKASIMEPAFSQTAIDRVRGQVIAGIKADATDPASIASQTFFAAAFPDHPYGTPKAGTIESVSALTRSDMFEAHDSVLAKDRLFVAVVGDISAPELGVLLDELLGDLPDTAAPPPPHANYDLGPGVTVVPFDTPQSVSLFGHEGIRRDDPDYIPAYILNEIFGGGGFESRLMQEVREKRGLTYGIGTFLSPMEYGELLLGQVRSDNARMAETIDVVREEWKKIATDGITAKELDDAKRYLTGSYALRFDGNATIARILVGMQMVGLPTDYLNTRNDQVMAVTLEEINRVAKRVFKPENLHFVVVGKPAGLKESP